MVRLLTALTSGVLLLVSSSDASAAAPARYRWAVGLDIGYADTTGNPSWTEGSVGKLRYDDENDGWIASRAFADYQLHITDSLDGRVVTELYDDDLGSTLDLTQAYLEWRPLTLAANRYRVKLGAFYPPLSLENKGPGWTNSYTLNSSAINTWIGEEVKVFGSEVSVSRRPRSLGGAHTFSLQAAAFYNNDPSGALLAWKGWSLHDRQSRFGDKLPLAALPQIQSDGIFASQDPFTTPFREVDNRVGYYLNGEWSFARRFLLRIMHYDDRGDPGAIEHGQYAWGTEFNHVGIQSNLPGNIGLVAQWISGATTMGAAFEGIHKVDVRYDSNFVLLTKAVSRHRISGRYDHFEVSQIDSTPFDDNSESGHAWTLSYEFRASGYASIAAEWLQIRSNRPAWAYLGFDTGRTERQLQLSVRLRFRDR